MKTSAFIVLRMSDQVSELRDCNKPEGKLSKSGEAMKLETGWEAQGFYDRDGTYYERLRKGHQERWLEMRE